MYTSEPLTSSKLEIHLFGHFAVYIDGKLLQETDVKGRKARSLLKLIAHQRNHQMVREHAIELLWPDLDLEAANAQLYKALHHIRKAFAKHEEAAENWIEITDDLIRVAPPGGLETDINLFEKAARSGLKNKEIADLEWAASIYAGEFLPMNRYAEWASLPREHYRQLYLDLLTVLAEEYEKLGELSEAAEMLRLALEKEPTLETAHRGLMRVFTKKGQSTRAFHQYEVCRNILGEELGLSPSSETTKTLDDIREGRLWEEKIPHERKSSFPGSPSPIVGREEECKQLDRLLEQVAREKGSPLIICGEAGIGKTRMIRELILRARRRELPFYIGKTGSGAGEIAYGPFIELFEEILHRHPELEEALPVELARLVPGHSGEGTPAPHADKLAAKGHLLAGVHHFISRVSENETPVLILEDLHDADRGSRELFSYLALRLDRLPVLLVSTIRKEETESVTDFIPELSEVVPELLELVPLTYDEHIKLLHQNAGNDIVGEAAAGRIYQLAEGNPLYALELLRHHLGDGAADSGPDNRESESSEQPGLSASTGIPSSLRQLVGQKLQKLSAPAHRLLYMAAVIGRQVPYELLASLWAGDKGNSEEELFGALEEIVRRRLLEEQGLDYSFCHALVQEAIYSSISGPRRRRLHRRVADTMLKLAEETDELPVEKIARHFIGAGEMMEGARYLIRAGERARSAYAHEDALERFREACDVLKEADGKKAEKLRGEIHARIGDVYRACGLLEMSYEAYEEAIRFADKGYMEAEGLVELYRKMAVVAIFRTEIGRAGSYLEKAFEGAGDEPRPKARLFITKALYLWHQNRLEEAYEIAREALAQAQEVGAKVEISQAYEMLAMICLPLGRWEEGLEYEKKRQFYGWSPEIVVATDAHLCLWEYHVSGDQPLQQARSFMEQIAEQATQVGDLRCVAVCHYALGTMHLWRGQRSRAVKELSSSFELHERVGSPAGMAYSLARKSVLHTLTGALELGWQAVRKGLDYAEQASVRDHCQQRLYGVGIWNRLEADDWEEARQIVEKSERLLEETGACGACALELYPWMAYYYLKAGRIDQASICGEAVADLAEQTGNPLGEAISHMIESSLCVTEQNGERAEACRKRSFQILEEAVPETDHSPVAHFLGRMISQQGEMMDR